MPFKIDELFYELDARTTGFENRIAHAQSTVDNFAKFIRDKPMLAVAALSAAIVAVGVAAVKMASDVDDSIRQVQANFPGATAEVGKLRNAIALLSTETPRSQKELAEAAAEISKRGVGSVDELIARLRQTALVADATGESMTSISDGLDLISDAFRLTTREASQAVTQIFGFTQGKVGISEVFEVLGKGAPVLADLGVKAEDAGQALAALIDAGVNRRQAGLALVNVLELTNRVRELRRGTEDQAKAADIIDATLSRSNISQKGFLRALGELATGLEKAGVDTRELGIRQNTLTAITRVAEVAAKDHRTQAEKLADAQERLSRAADTNRTSAHALSQILLNELSESFIKLGNKILPTVISLLEKTADVMARIRGEGNALKDLKILQGALPEVGANPNATLRQTKFESPADRAAREFERALKGAGTRAERYGADAFSGLTEAELRKLIDNVQKYSGRASAGTSPGQIDTLYRTLQEALQKAIAEAAGEKPGAGTGGGKPDTAPLEKATRDAIRAMRDSVAATMANASVTQIDDARAMVTKFRAEVDALEKQARQKLPDLRAEVDRLATEPARVEAKERAEAARSVADEVAKALGMQSVAMSQALEDFNAEVAKRNAEYAKLGKAPLFTDDQIEQVRAVRQALISATEAAEQTDAVLSRIRAQETARTPLTPASTTGQRTEEMGFNVASQIELEAELAKRRQELAAVAGNQDAASKAKSKALLDQIATLQGKINGLVTTNRQISNDINAGLLRRIQLLTEQASAIGSAVGLVAQLAGAFGDTGQRIAGIISGIGQIGQAAASVKPFLKALDVFKAGTKDDAGNPLMSLGGLIGQAMPVIGGITAAVGLIGQLFGGDPRAEQARAENNSAMQRLTAALVDLRDAYLQNVSSADVQTDISNMAKVIAQIGRDNFGRTTFGGDIVGPDKSGGGPGSRGTLRAIGRSLGMDYDSGELLKYFQDFDRRYGTNFAQFIERQAPQGLLQAIQNAPDAIKAALGNLGKYANDAAGVIDRVNYQFGVLGKTNAAEKFKAIIDSLRTAGIDMGDFAQDLATIADAGATAEQRQAAIEDALAKIAAGANYGGLTPEQLQQLLQQGAEAARGAGPLGTGGFNVDRTITEVTGSRLQALLLTGNTYLEQIAYATVSMAALMGVTGLPGISPPQISGTSVGAGGVTYNITVNLEGPISGAMRTRSETVSAPES
jgi:TP901 family phage tail tape measure protein